MPRMQVLQHEHFEGTANIGRWALQNGYDAAHALLYEGHALPDAHDYEWLVVMGGGMGVYETERYAWLRAEIQFIREAIELKRKVLGVCLGAQLIAAALGARVYPGPEKEIGWFPVTRTPESYDVSWFSGFPQTFTPLHWHGDTFDLPAGAVRLASSEAYENQAFQYGDNVIALQFHLELARLDVQAFLAAASEPKAGRWVQSGTEILSQPHNFEAGEALLVDLLNRMSR